MTRRRYIHPATEMVYREYRDLVTMTQHHPYRDDDQITDDLQRSNESRFRRPTADVQAARVHLGARFPELANHDERIRLFYCLAWMKGLAASPEARCDRGRCDVLVSTWDNEPLLIIEVKTDATAPAADQVARYRQSHPGAIAVVTATSFPPKLVQRAATLDVRLLSGQQVVDLLEDLAVWNLWRNRRRLSVEVAA